MRFNGVVPPERTEQGDDSDDEHGDRDERGGHDGQGSRDPHWVPGERERSHGIVFSFDRAACLRTLLEGDRVPVVVSGTLRDGRDFVAFDTVRVLSGRPLGDRDDEDPAKATRDEPFPVALALSGGAPNPFSATTRLRFGLPRTAHVRLEVFDLAGRRSRVLVDRYLPAGWHDARWDGRDASGRRSAPGVFVVRLHAGGEARTRRVAWLPF